VFGLEEACSQIYEQFQPNRTQKCDVTK